MTDDDKAIFEHIRRMGVKVPSWASLNTIDPRHNKPKVYSTVSDAAVVRITNDIDDDIEALLKALKL
jgi:hypothetical protein